MSKILALSAGLILVLMSCSDNNPAQLPDNYMQNRDKFITTIKTFLESNNISAELPNLQTNEQNIQGEKMITLIKKGIELSGEISDEFLTYLNPDLPANFRNKLVKSNELYLDGYTSKFSNLNDSVTSLQKQIQANQLLYEWAAYWKNNYDKITNKITVKKSFGQKLKGLITADKSKKSYWRLFVRFIISDLVLNFVFFFFVFAILIPFAPIKLLKEKLNKVLQKIISISFIIILYVGIVYFGILWAAYCAFTVQFYMDSPTVSQNWLYYITGFFFLILPITILTQKETPSSYIYTVDSIKQKKIQDESFAYSSLILIVVFVVFCIWTNLLDYKYIFWINDWIY